MNDLTERNSNNMLSSELGISTVGMAPGLALMFNDALYEKCTRLASVMAKADGTTPRHLIGKPEACFAVITQSITWRLDPFAVARCTYQTPGGSVGFEGKLIQAILENSGKLEGSVKYEHFGPWENVVRKFEIKQGKTGKDYAAPTWTRDDAAGCGVRVYAKVVNELEPREFEMRLEECFPLNSTLWATRPKQQICYTACRAFANIAAPGLLMGVPFEGDSDFGSMKDVTPPPRPVMDERPVDTAAYGFPPDGSVKRLDDPHPDPTHEAKVAQMETIGNEPDVVQEPETTPEPTELSEQSTEADKADLAYAAGVNARIDNKSIYDVPKIYGHRESEAYKAGWRDQDKLEKGE